MSAFVPLEGSASDYGAGLYPGNCSVQAPYMTFFHSFLFYNGSSFPNVHDLIDYPAYNIVILFQHLSFFWVSGVFCII